MLESEPARPPSSRVLQLLSSIYKSINKIYLKLIKRNYKSIPNSSNTTYDFKDKLLKEVMVSRKDTYCLDVNDSLDSVLNEIINLNVGYIPVFENNTDNIIGVINRTLLVNKLNSNSLTNISLENILLKPIFVPQTLKIGDLINFIDIKSDSLLILINEYGGFSGVVNVEILLKQIEESNCHLDINTNSKITKIDNNNFIVKGILNIDDFNKIFNANIQHGDYDTLNGYIINYLGQIPKESENIVLNINSISFKLLKIEKRRIEDIHVSLL